MRIIQSMVDRAMVSVLMTIALPIVRLMPQSISNRRH